MKKLNTVFGQIPVELFHGYKIKKSLGSGIYGEAFLTINNQVIKVTREKGEYLWAKEMIGNECKHVVNVYGTWECTFNNDQMFFIREEKLDTKSIGYDTRHNVYTILNSVLYTISEKQYRSRKELSIILSGKDSCFFETIARTAFKNYPKEKYILNSLLDAYMESLLVNSRIKLDLSAGNFGVSKDGTIKVFDCCLPEKVTYSSLPKESLNAFTFNIIMEQ